MLQIITVNLCHSCMYVEIQSLKAAVETHGHRDNGVKSLKICLRLHLAPRRVAFAFLIGPPKECP